MTMREHWSESKVNIQADRMASAVQVQQPQLLRPLLRDHRSTSKSLVFRNPRRKWTTQMNNDACCTPRFAHFHHPHNHPAYRPLSLCPSLLLPRPRLYSLLQPRSPHFRHSLHLMTTPQAAVEDSTQPSTRTVRAHLPLALFSFVIMCFGCALWTVSPME